MQDRAFLPNLGKFGSPYIFFSNDVNADLLYISDSVEEVLGFSSQQLVGRKYTDLLASNELNNSLPELRRRRFSGDAIQRSLCAVKNRNQDVRVLKVQTYGETDASGNVVTNHGIAEDITDVYQKQEELWRRFSELEEITQKLSVREHTVLELVMAGRLNKTISSELEITVRGVERIRARLMTKLSANTSAQLVTIATEWKVLARVLAVWLPVTAGDTTDDRSQMVDKYRRMFNSLEQ